MQKKINHESKGRAGQGKAGRLILLIVFWGIVHFHAFPQQSQYAFEPGEQVTYGAYYNWHFIWVHAGEVIFSADTLSDNQQTQLNLKAVGKTFKTYDFFYTVRDTFQSQLIYDSFTPIYFHREMNHARKSSMHNYRFDTKSAKVYSTIKRDKKQDTFSDTLQYPANTFDLLSTAYYFRSFDFSKMQKGRMVKFKMLVDNKLEDLYFRYLGQEVVKTRKGERFQCHKVSVMLLEGDFFPKGEHMKVWFTNDKNKLPVMVETEIAVGFVKAILTGYSNLKYPLTSKIKEDGKH